MVSNKGYYEYIGHYRHLNNDKFSTMIASKPPEMSIIIPKCVQFRQCETIIYETLINMPDGRDIWFGDNLSRKNQSIKRYIEKICIKLVGSDVYRSMSINYVQYREDDYDNDYENVDYIVEIYIS
jgi:hypothetical protein